MQFRHCLLVWLLVHATFLERLWHYTRQLDSSQPLSRFLFHVICQSCLHTCEIKEGDTSLYLVLRIPLLLLQDMRVQAFECCTNISSSQPTLPQDTTPASQTQAPQTSNGASSSDWVSRTAALTACIPQRPASNPEPANNASGLPTSLFNSHNAPQNGTNQQGTAASPQTAKVACPPEGGALMGSSAMADSHCGVVVALALCGEYVCSAGGDAMIKVWKADSLEFVRYSVGAMSATSIVRCVALH